MHLTPEEYAVFREAQDGLLLFIHQARNLQPTVRTRQEFAALPLADLVPARQAWRLECFLLEDYLKEAGKDVAHRDLLESWRAAVFGKFTVVKQLRAGAIFQGEDGKHYQVLGPSNSVESALPGMPLLVDTALLPFRGRIVYDGVMRTWPVVFGRGMRKRVNDEYQRARRQGLVLTSLEPKAAPPAPPRPAAPDRSAETADLVKRAHALRGGNTPFESPAYTLLRAAAGVAHMAASGERDVLELDRELAKVRRAVTRLQNVLFDET